MSDGKMRPKVPEWVSAQATGEQADEPAAVLMRSNHPADVYLYDGPATGARYGFRRGKGTLVNARDATVMGKVTITLPAGCCGGSLKRVTPLFEEV